MSFLFPADTSERRWLTFAVAVLPTSLDSSCTTMLLLVRLGRVSAPPSDENVEKSR